MIEKPTTLNERFGPIPNDDGLLKRMRLHQGWWRTNVLNELPGAHPTDHLRKICNTITNGESTHKNFLTPNIIQTVQETLSSRIEQNAGIIEKERLFNNLLSSQPLCFNFFGEFFTDLDFGLIVLQTFYPELTKLNMVIFEFAPKENFTKDKSAFDIAFEVEIGEKKGLIGLECKYTDKFSFKPSKSEIFYGDEGNKNFHTYKEIYDKSKISFIKPFFDFVKSKDYNQLFRNQLIKEALLINRHYDFVYTGLFCFQDDIEAITIGENFKTMLSNSENFQVITYSEYISRIQQLKLDWKKREWTMLLWARYCATSLSNSTTLTLQ